MSSSMDPALLPGEVLEEKYRIERVIGRGGMGIVLLARNMLLGERVAVKVLAREATAAMSSRLLMEARAAARMRSDHVVRIFDVGCTAGGTPYLVMEFLEGRALSEVVRDGGPVASGQAVRWVLEACEALAEAHRHGVIHRDVKPANLFLEQRPDRDSRIKVLDFGIAKLPEGENLVATTHPIGSPIYMAPEQLANVADVDQRVDVWGIGCVLHELLAGAPPFAARSVFELASKVSAGLHPRLGAIRAELPAGLCAVVERCLQPERAARFRDLPALARALGPFAPPEAAGLVGRIERLGAGALGATLDAGQELTRSLEALESGAGESPATSSTPALTRARLSGSGSRPAARRAAVAAVVVLIAAALGVTSRRGGRSLETRPARVSEPVSAPPAPAPAETAPSEPAPAAAPPASPAVESRPAPRVRVPELPVASAPSVPGVGAASSAAEAAPRAPRARPLRGPHTGNARPPPSAGAPLADAPVSAGAPRPNDGAAAEPPGAGPLPIDRESPW